MSDDELKQALSRVNKRQIDNTMRLPVLDWVDCSRESARVMLIHERDDRPKTNPLPPPDHAPHEYDSDEDVEDITVFLPGFVRSNEGIHNQTSGKSTTCRGATQATAVTVLASGN